MEGFFFLYFFSFFFLPCVSSQLIMDIIHEHNEPVANLKDYLSPYRLFKSKCGHKQKRKEACKSNEALTHMRDKFYFHCL